MEVQVRTRVSLILLASSFGVVFHAQTPNSIRLTGHVSSMEEGRMEGVLVSAKKAGSTITTTVVSDEQDRYRFQSAKLEPGKYSLGSDYARESHHCRSQFEKNARPQPTAWLCGLTGMKTCGSEC
jgi:hypothetical protein